MPGIADAKDVHGGVVGIDHEEALQGRVVRHDFRGSFVKDARSIRAQRFEFDAGTGGGGSRYGQTTGQ